MKGGFEKLNEMNYRNSGITNVTQGFSLPKKKEAEKEISIGIIH